MKNGVSGVVNHRMLLWVWVSWSSFKCKRYLTRNREQFVLQTLARGDKVIATGRNASTKLAHLQGTGATILDLDLTMSEAEVAAKIKEAHQIFGRIDLLVNNAGYIESGAVEEMSYVLKIVGII